MQIPGVIRYYYPELEDVNLTIEQVKGLAESKLIELMFNRPSKDKVTDEKYNELCTLYYELASRSLSKQFKTKYRLYEHIMLLSFSSYIMSHEELRAFLLANINDYSYIDTTKWEDRESCFLANILNAICHIILNDAADDNTEILAKIDVIRSYNNFFTSKMVSVCLDLFKFFCSNTIKNS